MTDFVNSLGNTALLDILLLSSDATAIYTGEDLRVEAINQGMLAIFGKDKSVRGMTFQQAFKELQGQPFTQTLIEAQRSGQTYTAKNVPAELNLNGHRQICYFDFIYRPIKDQNDKVICILHTATEVSERVNAIQLAREKALAEQRAYEQLEVINEEYRATTEELNAANEELQALGEEYQVTNEELNAANEELSAVNEEQHRLNQKLQTLENERSQLISSSPVGMTILQGNEFIIEMANAPILALWSRSPEQTLGRKFLEVFPELLDQPFPEMLRDVMATGNPLAIKEAAIDITGMDGSSEKHYIDFAYQPLLGTDGLVTKIMVTISDITQIVTVRQELERIQLQLNQTNEELAAVNEEYIATNEELSQLNEEYNAANEELNAANKILVAAGITSDKENIELTSLNLELKKRNLALAYSEKRALELFFDAPVAIGLLSGPELSIISANPELLRLWGKTGAILEKPLEEALPELKGQPFSEILHQVYTTGKSAYGTGEKVTLNRDGKLEDCYFNFIYKPIKDKKGRSHSIMIVAGEVTQQVHAIHSAQDISDRLSVALGAASLGSYDLELATGKMECSDRCKLNFGRNIAEEFNFPDLIQAILPQYRDTVQKAVQDAIKTGGIYEAEYQIQLPEGGQRWIHASGSPRYDAQNNPLRMIGVTLDITQRKAYEQKREDFLSIAAHELKTPITVLKANLQLLERIKSELESPKAKRLIEGASASMAKVNILVEDLLNISKHSGGRLELEKTWFDIPQILDTCCSHVRIQGNYELIVTGEKRLKVFADEHRIEQVLVNLVNNAVKYAPDSKQIYLILEKTAEHAKISVKDFGPGISPEQVPRLFDRYWQAEKSSNGYSGLGLGLAICAEIIEQHGGTIGVDSTLGAGATFWFTLPL
ncbi:PAS domain-containing protein [Pedobacter sp. GR22-6]|uniref:PAS domain-containing protein n=1 Tax=Pedobacter sp. GR22-6 TaxID=3127957 RepID=UPI00307DC084